VDVRTWGSCLPLTHASPLCLSASQCKATARWDRPSGQHLGGRSEGGWAGYTEWGDLLHRIAATTNPPIMYPFGVAKLVTLHILAAFAVRERGEEVLAGRANIMTNGNRLLFHSFHFQVFLLDPLSRPPRLPTGRAGDVEKTGSLYLSAVSLEIYTPFLATLCRRCTVYLPSSTSANR